jgi:hypothetical protein
MPELNLDNLKTKRSTSKKRPWDMEIPVPKKVENEAVSVKAMSSRELEDPKDEPRPDKKSIGEDDSLRKKIEAELRKEYELKIKELNKIKADAAKPYEDENYSSIEASLKDNPLLQAFAKPIRGEDLLDILSRLSKLSSPSRELYTYLLKETDNGKLKDVQIGRKKIEEEVPGVKRAFKNSIKQLEENGLVEKREGYIRPTKRKGLFYTIV